MSLAKLTALSTQTLSLLLERQRLQSLSPAITEGATNSSLHLPQITRNLALLRSGIQELESTGDHSEAVVLLRNQHVRMRGMVGSDAVIDPLPEPTATQVDDDPQAREKPQHAWPTVDKQAFTPYTDDPEAGRDPVSMLQEQQRLMDGGCRARPPCFHDTLNLGLQTRTYIWIRFHAQLRVSVIYQCRSMTNLKCTRDCWRNSTMILMIQEFGWAGLVNESDVLPIVQRSTVSGYPLRVWDGS